VPDPTSRKREHEANPKAFPEGGWFVGDSALLAVGQGELVVSPLQLANAYSTFANGGTLWQPRLAARILDQNGTVVQNLQPVVLHKVDLPSPIRDPLLSGFKGVVADPSGTAHLAFSGFPLSSFQVAGKTGTAQVAGKQDTAVFTSFAPADNPQYVVDCFIEQAGFGGDAAAPVVRRIYDGLLGHPLQPVSITVRSVD
jgi:penicillin-binding protein 2